MFLASFHSTNARIAPVIKQTYFKLFLELSHDLRSFFKLESGHKMERQSQERTRATSRYVHHRPILLVQFRPKQILS